MSFADLFSRLGAPVIQAPMAGVQNHRLAATVCEAGGLGSLAAAMLTPESLQAELQALSAATDQPYNVNFFCHTPPPSDSARQAAWEQALSPYYREMGLDPAAMPSGPGRVPFGHDSADVLETFQPAVVSFHFGLPAPDLLARVKGWGSSANVPIWVLKSSVKNMPRCPPASSPCATTASAPCACSHRASCTVVADDNTRLPQPFTRANKSGAGRPK